MKEQAIVAVATGWVAQRMNLTPQSSGKSNLLDALDTPANRPAVGFVPSEDRSLVCFEMPLLASLNANAMTEAYTKRCIRTPEHHLKGHQLRPYANKNALRGDLVFWKSRQEVNKYLRAFGEPDEGAGDTPFGLEHVALATGQSATGQSQVISFWESNKVEITEIGTVTGGMTRESGLQFDVSVARGPWYWGYWVW